MTDPMTPSIPDALLDYFASREQQRAEQVRRRLDALSPREQWLVREAAVMGFVQGVRSVPGGHKAEIPPDADIVARVVLACDSFSDRYPVLAGSVTDLIRKIVRAHQPVDLAQLVDAVTGLAACDAGTVVLAVRELVDDELLAHTRDGLREVSG